GLRVLRLDGVEDPVVGQCLQQRSHVGGGGPAVALEHAGGPVGVPAGAGGGVVELAALPAGAGARQLRHAPASGEGGHDVRVVASAPEAEAGASVLPEGGGPGVADRALGAEAFEDGADPAAPGGPAVRATAGVALAQLGRGIAEHVLGDLVELGAGDLHLGLGGARSEEHTSELQSRFDLVCRLLLEKKKAPIKITA